MIRSTKAVRIYDIRPYYDYVGRIRGLRQAANLEETPNYFTNTGARSQNQNPPVGNIRSPSEAHFTGIPEILGVGKFGEFRQSACYFGMFRIPRDMRPATNMVHPTQVVRIYINRPKYESRIRMIAPSCQVGRNAEVFHKYQ